MRIGIIGAGSAGYVCAIRCADLGATVTLFEESKLGGTCLNVGCIPTKALIAGIHAKKIATSSQALGLSADNAHLDIETLHTHKNNVVSTNVRGIGYLLKKRKVVVYDGHAKIKSPTTIEVDGDELEYDKIIIATGSKPAGLPGVEIDGKYIINSDHALSMTEIPKTMLIVGGGVIGLEFAHIFSAFGAKVTVVEMMERLLPQDDQLCSRAASKFASSHGIDVMLNSKIFKLFRDGNDVQAHIEKGDEETVSRFGCALVATGRVPNIDRTSMMRIGAEHGKWGIKVDSYMQTTVPGVYAIGDCTGGYMLAHVAYGHAKVAAGHATGKHSYPMRQDNIPRITFVDPEISACGYTSTQLEERGIVVTWHRFMYMASGKAKAQNIKEGQLNIAVDVDGRIRSAVITGEGSGEMIAFFSQAITMETTIEQLSQVIIAHPTMAEMALEIVEVASGYPIHV
jgi:dihydrolipoamide dehydrogenase